MHKNYRRKNPRPSHKQGWRNLDSLAWERAREARRRRRREVRLIFRGLYDRVPNKYPRDLLYRLL